MSISSFFKKIFDAIKKVFKKAEPVLAQVNALLPYAIEAVKVVAAATPNKADDQIAELLQSIQMADEVEAISYPMTDVQRKGYLLAAANQILRGKVDQAITNSAGAAIAIGADKIKEAKVLPDRLIDLAVQTAYTFLRSEEAN